MYAGCMGFIDASFVTEALHSTCMHRAGKCSSHLAREACRTEPHQTRTCGGIERTERARGGIRKHYWQFAHWRSPALGGTIHPEIEIHHRRHMQRYRLPCGACAFRLLRSKSAASAAQTWGMQPVRLTACIQKLQDRPGATALLVRVLAARRQTHHVIHCNARARAGNQPPKGPLACVERQTNTDCSQRLTHAACAQGETHLTYAQRETDAAWRVDHFLGWLPQIYDGPALQHETDDACPCCPHAQTLLQLWRYSLGIFRTSHPAPFPHCPLSCPHRYSRTI